MSMVKETIGIDVPVSSVYNQWTQFEEFPRFMEGVEEVRQIDERHCHWKTKVAGSARPQAVQGLHRGAGRGERRLAGAHQPHGRGGQALSHRDHRDRNARRRTARRQAVRLTPTATVPTATVPGGGRPPRGQAVLRVGVTGMGEEAPRWVRKFPPPPPWVDGWALM